MRPNKTDFFSLRINMFFIIALFLPSAQISAIEPPRSMGDQLLLQNAARDIIAARADSSFEFPIDTCKKVIEKLLPLRFGLFRDGISAQAETLLRDSIYAMSMRLLDCQIGQFFSRIQSERPDVKITFLRQEFIDNVHKKYEKEIRKQQQEISSKPVWSRKFNDALAVLIDNQAKLLRTQGYPLQNELNALNCGRRFPDDALRDIIKRKMQTEFSAGVFSANSSIVDEIIKDIQNNISIQKGATERLDAEKAYKNNILLPSMLAQTITSDVIGAIAENYKKAHAVREYSIFTCVNNDIKQRSKSLFDNLLILHIVEFKPPSSLFPSVTDLYSFIFLNAAAHQTIEKSRALCITRFSSGPSGYCEELKKAYWRKGCENNISKKEFSNLFDSVLTENPIVLARWQSVFGSHIDSLLHTARSKIAETQVRRYFPLLAAMKFLPDTASIYRYEKGELQANSRTAISLCSPAPKIDAALNYTFLEETDLIIVQKFRFFLDEGKTALQTQHQLANNLLGRPEVKENVLKNALKKNADEWIAEYSDRVKRDWLSVRAKTLWQDKSAMPPDTASRYHEIFGRVRQEIRNKILEWLYVPRENADESIDTCIHRQIDSVQPANRLLSAKDRKALADTIFKHCVAGRFAVSKEREDAIKDTIKNALKRNEKTENVGNKIPLSIIIVVIAGLALCIIIIVLINRRRKLRKDKDNKNGRSKENGKGKWWWSWGFGRGCGCLRKRRLQTIKSIRTINSATIHNTNNGPPNFPPEEPQLSVITLPPSWRYRLIILMFISFLVSLVLSIILALSFILHWTDAALVAFIEDHIPWLWLAHNIHKIFLVLAIIFSNCTWLLGFVVLKCKLSLDVKEAVVKILLKDLHINISDKKAQFIGEIIEWILNFFFAHLFGWLTGLQPKIEASTKGVKVSRYDKNKHD